MGSARDEAVRAYLRLPRAIRKRVDPLIRDRSKHRRSFEARAEDGKRLLKGYASRLFAGNPKKRRRRR